MNEGIHNLCPICQKELVWRPYFQRWVCYNKGCGYVSDLDSNNEIANEMANNETNKKTFGLNEALKNCEPIKNVKSNDVILWKYPYNENIPLDVLNGIYESISNIFPTNTVIGIPMGSKMETMDIVNAIWYLEEEIKELRKKLKHEENTKKS